MVAPAEQLPKRETEQQPAPAEAEQQYTPDQVGQMADNMASQAESNVVELRQRGESAVQEAQNAGFDAAQEQQQLADIQQYAEQHVGGFLQHIKSAKEKLATAKERWAGRGLKARFAGVERANLKVDQQEAEEELAATYSEAEKNPEGQAALQALEAEKAHREAEKNLKKFSGLRGFLQREKKWAAVIGEDEALEAKQNAYEAVRVAEEAARAAEAKRMVDTANTLDNIHGKIELPDDPKLVEALKKKREEYRARLKDASERGNMAEMTDAAAKLRVVYSMIENGAYDFKSRPASEIADYANNPQELDAINNAAAVMKRYAGGRLGELYGGTGLEMPAAEAAPEAAPAEAEPEAAPERDVMGDLEADIRPSQEQADAQLAGMEAAAAEDEEAARAAEQAQEQRRATFNKLKERVVSALVDKAGEMVEEALKPSAKPERDVVQGLEVDIRPSQEQADEELARMEAAAAEWSAEELGMEADQYEQLQAEQRATAEARADEELARMEAAAAEWDEDEEKAQQLKNEFIDERDHRIESRNESLKQAQEQLARLKKQIELFVPAAAEQEQYAALAESATGAFEGYIKSLQQDIKNNEQLRADMADTPAGDFDPEYFKLRIFVEAESRKVGGDAGAAFSLQSQLDKFIADSVQRQQQAAAEAPMEMPPSPRPEARVVETTAGTQVEEPGETVGLEAARSDEDSETAAGEALSKEEKILKERDRRDLIGITEMFRRAQEENLSEIRSFQRELQSIIDQFSSDDPKENAQFTMLADMISNDLQAAFDSIGGYKAFLDTQIMEMRTMPIEQFDQDALRDARNEQLQKMAVGTEARNAARNSLMRLNELATNARARAEAAAEQAAAEAAAAETAEPMTEEEQEAQDEQVIDALKELKANKEAPAEGAPLSDEQAMDKMAALDKELDNIDSDDPLAEIGLLKNLQDIKKRKEAGRQQGVEAGGPMAIRMSEAVNARQERASEAGPLNNEDYAAEVRRIQGELAALPYNDREGRIAISDQLTLLADRNKLWKQQQ